MTFAICLYLINESFFINKSEISGWFSLHPEYKWYSIYKPQYSLLNPYKHFFLLFLLIKRPTKRILILPVKQIRCRRGWRFSIKKMLNRYITANKYSSDLGKTKNWISMRIKCLVATLNLLPLGLGENMICWTSTLGSICVLGANKL